MDSANVCDETCCDGDGAEAAIVITLDAGHELISLFMSRDLTHCRIYLFSQLLLDRNKFGS